MKWWVLLFVPLVAAQSGLPSHVDLQATLYPDLAGAVTEIIETDVDGPGAGCNPSPLRDEAIAISGNQPPEMVRYQAASGILLFSEGYDEQGCARIRVPVDLVGADAARLVRVSFNATRDIRTPGGPPMATSASQWVSVHPAGASERLECVERQPYFHDEVGARSGRISFDLPADVCQVPSAIDLEFFIGDIPTSTAATGSRPAQQAVTMRIADLRVDIVDIRSPVDPEVRDDLEPHSNRVGYTVVPITIADVFAGIETQASFQIAEGYDAIGVRKVGADQMLPAQHLLDLDGGGYRFTLPSTIITEHATGTYEVLFTQENSGIVTPALLPFAALALLAPLVAAVIAQRNVNHLHRTARGTERRLRFALQAGIGAAMAGYMAITFWLLISQRTVGMASVSMPQANRVAYGLLAAIVVILLLIAFWARRREMRIVLAEFNELERTQAELERSNEELEQFAYVASHDLKEPLRMVAGYTQLLDMRYGDRLDAQGRQFLDYASQGAKRLQNMVDDLLAYSRVRTDKSRLRDVKLDDVMTIVRGHLSGLLHDRKVRLDVGPMPVVPGEQGQLVQLLLNLVQNAIKFSPQESPRVEVTASQAGDDVEVRVRDEGIGIDPKQQERIFDIFQRLHLREEYEGNGIGLAMCRKIVEQHGGGIRVDSTPGAGSTFIIRLPARRREPGRPEPTTAPQPA